MIATILLRRIIEQPSQYLTGLTMKQKIELGRESLFGDMEYPIFDEDYRAVFETHFIRNFYFKEIGFETVGMFKFYLETWLQINMPYYNELFQSQLIKFDPLTNTKVETSSTKKIDSTRDNTLTDTSKQDGVFNQTTDASKNSNNTSEGLTDSRGFNRNIHLNTPQDKLKLTSNDDGTGAIDYATTITEDLNTGKGSTSSQQSGSDIVKDKSDSISQQNGKRDSIANEVGNELEEFVYLKQGKIGVQNFSKMLSDYRASFLRIENQLFNECNELFLQIWL